MDNILLWLWTSVLAATVLWWVVMLFCVAFIGPFEILAMFRSLNQSHQDDASSESNRST